MVYAIEIVSRSEREVLIASRVENSQEKGETIFDFRGGTYSPKVISLEINVPIYRMENCRTFSSQQSEIAVHGYSQDYFSKGGEKSSVQQAQHRILAKLANRGTSSVIPIVEVLKKDGQREPILITSTGVVVNGNRRLAAMRELFRANDGSVDNRFSHVRCAVLPVDTTLDEIDDIEADLQARPQTKLEYDWIGDAQLIRRQVSKGRTTKEVADRLRRSKVEVENTLQALDEADLYLSQWAGKPGQYDLISADGEQIFTDIPKRIAKKSNTLQNGSRAIAWTLFDNRKLITGRIYSLNAAFGKLAPQVLEMLAEEVEISDDLGSSDEAEDFSFEIETNDGDRNYDRLVDFLKDQKSNDDLAQTLINVCESAIEKDRGLRSEKAALKTLSQAHSKLLGIDVSMAGADTLPAMKKQVDAMREALQKIEEKIDARLSSAVEN